MTEKQFQAAVVEAARWTGWIDHHQLNSKGSRSGWPDLTLIPKKQGMGQTVFAELKSAKGRLSQAQRDTLTGLRNSGLQRVWIWRPSDLDAILAWFRTRQPEWEGVFEAHTIEELYTFGTRHD